MTSSTEADTEARGPRSRKAPPARRYLIGVVGTLGLGAWLVSSIEPGELGSLWEGRALAPLGLAFLSYGGVYFFRALRYGTVGVRLRFVDLFTVAVVHSFLNRVLPVRSGEVVYGYLVRRLGGTSFTSGMVGLLQIRLLDIFCVASFYALALLSYGGTLGFERSEGLTIAGLALAAMLFAYAVLGPVLSLLARFLERAAQTRAGLVARAAAIAATVAAEVNGTPPVRRLALLGTCIGAWGLSYITYWFILRGFSVALPLSTVILGASLANLTSSLPITVVGSFGALEAGWLAGFVFVGLDQSLAAATGVAFSVVTLVYAALYGALGAMRLATWDPSSPSDLHPKEHA